MKLNKILFSVFTLSVFLTNTCVGIDENERNQTPRQEIVQDRVEITERLIRPNPDSSTILDAIKNPRENKPSNELNEQNSEQKVEKPRPKKSVKKKETTEKKVEPVQVQEQEQQNNPAENSEPTNDSQDDKPLPEVSNDEVEKFKNRIPTSSQKEGKEYIIRGLVSMMLVIAGAILLVVVIITSVENKKRKYNKKKDKNYFDDKF